MNKLQIAIVIFSMLIVLFIQVWVFFIAPEIIKIPEDFTYRADIISKDNFYNAEIENYTDEIGSDTEFSYEVVSSDRNFLEIKNVFDVRTPAGEPIFSVERIYGIDRKTREHAPGHGDKDRQGYLFAPRKLKHGQNYTYWHINYDVPAEMEFQNEEIIGGLLAYRYETNYNADQTENLGHLPGVPEERGVELDINLQIWVEPITGRLIKYEDNTIAYYYNIKTGERIHPWNKFNNKYTESSVIQSVRLAHNMKQKTFLIEIIIPILLYLTVVIFLIALWMSGK